MPEVDVGGVRIHYDTTARRGDWLPVLLSHGYSASATMWEPNLAALAASRRVITWDMRGHGASDSPDDPACYSEARCVRDMAAVLDAVGAERAIVGGMSLGGYLSLAFALGEPGRVAALVLCDTGPGYKRDEPRREWNLQAEKAARDWEADRVEVSASRPELAPLAQQNRRGLALAARGMVVQHDSRVIEALPTIDVPTLIIVGADDAGFRAAADYMAHKMPRAQLVVIPDARHAANIDQPAVFNQCVREFLDPLP